MVLPAFFVALCCSSLGIPGSLTSLDRKIYSLPEVLKTESEPSCVNLPNLDVAGIGVSFQVQCRLNLLLASSLFSPGSSCLVHSGLRP